MQNEIVYILINEAMQGYCKVGRTIDLEQRMRSLDNTSIPLPFECFYACTVTDANFVEKQLHDAFGDNRVRSNREWFEISPERVASALRIAQIEDMTPGVDYVENEEEQRALDETRERKKNLSFKMIDISTGAQLNFTRGEEIYCIVLDNKRVIFEDEEMSLSAAAQKALEMTGTKPWKSAQGGLYWMYEGETLVERRKRMEEE
jgi:hypothetical protein